MGNGQAATALAVAAMMMASHSRTANAGHGAATSVRVHPDSGPGFLAGMEREAHQDDQNLKALSMGLGFWAGVAVAGAAAWASGWGVGDAVIAGTLIFGPFGLAAGGAVGLVVRDVKAMASGIRTAIEQSGWSSEWRDRVAGDALKSLSDMGIDVPNREALALTDGNAYFIRDAGVSDGRLTMVTRGQFQDFVDRSNTEGGRLTLIDQDPKQGQVTVRRLLDGALNEGAEQEPSLERMAFKNGQIESHLRFWHVGGSTVRPPHERTLEAAEEEPRLAS